MLSSYIPTVKLDLVPKGGLVSVVPFSYFTEELRNVGISCVLVVYTWFIQLTRVTQLGTKWTL
jgi:hypothetical protein